MIYKRTIARWYYISITACLYILTGCVDEPVSRGEDSRFFNVTSFMENQIALLDSLNPQVSKKVLVDDTVDSKVVSDIEWARELELFAQADISRPALQTSYEVENSSNRVRIFKARTDENPTVKYLKVEFDEQTSQIMALEAVISQSNYLYHSEKKINLRCRKLSANQVIIQSYQISGFQKLIFNDKVPYQVEASIL